MRVTRYFFSGYIAACVLVAMLSCGDDSTSPTPEPDSGPVDTDGANSVTRTIGSEGGSISATGSDGIGYVLDIPEGSLMEATEITVTPVLGIEGLGLSGGLAGAVVLRPAGLSFAQSAVLRIVTTRSPATGERMAGFVANGNFSSRGITISASDDDEIAILVPHFSVVGAGFGTLDDVAAFPTPSTNPIETLIQALNILPTPWDNASRQAAEQFAQQAFSQVVIPRLQDADTDEKLLAALHAYDRWRYMLAVIEFAGEAPLEGLFNAGTSLPIPAGFGASVIQALEIAAIAIKNAIDGNNAVCEANQSLTALANALYWQNQAKLLGIDTPENALDLDTILETLCAEVVIEGVQLPTPMQVGFPHSLDVFCGVLFGASGAPIPAPFQISVSGTGVDIQDPAGFTSEQGQYVTVVTATASTVSITVTACLIRPGSIQPTPLCATSADNSGQAVDLTGTYLGTVRDFRYSSLTVTQNQNAVAGTFELRSTVRNHTGSFTATLAGTSLVGIDIELDGCTFDGQPTGTVLVNNDDITIRIDPNGTDCHGNPVDIIYGCGPNSSLNTIDLAGSWSGAFLISSATTPALSVNLTLSGGVGQITGNFTGDRTGSFSATVVSDPNTGGCVFAQLTDIAITFTGGCELLPGSPLESGCVEFMNGNIITIVLTTQRQWRDSCTGHELTGLSFSRVVDTCNDS